MRRGYTVFRLVRNPQKIDGGTIYWDPSCGDVPAKALEGIGSVIHLAGENISEGRWTKKRKEAIFQSRCRDTWLLSQALARLSKPPQFFFSASAIGYYGDRGDEILTEDAPAGAGFLPFVCTQWERATHPLSARGVRVVHGRFGVVLSPEGGMLKKIAPLFKLCLGGKLGNGKQWMSWIALSDLVRALIFCMENPQAVGTFNFTAPSPVRNAEFTQILAQSLHRPAFLTLPAPLLRLALGEMANELFLASARAVPMRLLQHQFEFRDPLITAILDRKISYR